jgi:hypothetical protein
MSDPKRLLHGAGGPLAMELLAAGRDELPSDEVIERALARATLAAGAAVTLSHSMLAHAMGEGAQAASHTSQAIEGMAAIEDMATHAAASGSTATGATVVGGVAQSAGVAAGATKLGVSAAVLSKWVGIAAVGIGVSSAAPAALRWLDPPGIPLSAKPLVRDVPASAPVQAAPQQPNARAAPALGAARQPTMPGFARAPSRETQERPSALPVRPLVRAPARSALDELRLVDSAREALQSGDAARALDVLQHYEARIAERQFELEVAVLRMDALERLGRIGAAQRQARQLLTRSLPEPQAARARAILDRRE